MPCAVPTIIASCGFLVPNVFACAQRGEGRGETPAASMQWVAVPHPRWHLYFIFLSSSLCLTEGRKEATPSSPKEAGQTQAGGEPRQGLRRRGQAAAGGPQETAGGQAGRLREAELRHGERGQHRDLRARGPDPALRPGSKQF